MYDRDSFRVMLASRVNYASHTPSLQSRPTGQPIFGDCCNLTCLALTQPIFGDCCNLTCLALTSPFTYSDQVLPDDSHLQHKAAQTSCSCSSSSSPFGSCTFRSLHNFRYKFTSCSGLDLDSLQILKQVKAGMDELRIHGALVLSAKDDPLPKAIDLIEGLGLPGGLLPLEDVVECGFVQERGYVWIKQKKKVQHCFQKVGRQVRYGEQITCTLQKNCLKNLTGVKAKELLLWVPVNEIVVEELPSTKIHFRSIGGISRTFPVDAFARGE